MKKDHLVQADLAAADGAIGDLRAEIARPEKK